MEHLSGTKKMAFQAPLSALVLPNVNVSEDMGCQVQNFKFDFKKWEENHAKKFQFSIWKTK